MSNFFLCASGFTEREKRELEILAILLGAKYTAALKLNITTHLICKEPKGPKFEAALKGNIRVVNKKWLEECAIRVRESFTTKSHLNLKRFLYVKFDF
jgi:topoisomerase (DNA) II binding protein 1